jgi:hypothetical protein
MISSSLSKRMKPAFIMCTTLTVRRRIGTTAADSQRISQHCANGWLVIKDGY